MFGYYAMTKPSLQREPVIGPDPYIVLEARLDLAKKASTVLNYHRLARIIPDSESLVAAKMKVAEVFKELDFQPLAWNKVKAYQRWYVRKYSYDTKFSSTRVSWREISLACYDDAVPEFVLSRAVELKEKLPEAQFVVEYPYYERILRDPFLRMDYKSLNFYTDVWDEPKFEARRTA